MYHVSSQSTTDMGGYRTPSDLVSSNRASLSFSCPHGSAVACLHQRAFTHNIANNARQQHSLLLFIWILKSLRSHRWDQYQRSTSSRPRVNVRMNRGAVSGDVVYASATCGRDDLFQFISSFRLLPSGSSLRTEDRWREGLFLHSGRNSQFRLYEVRAIGWTCSCTLSASSSTATCRLPPSRRSSCL